MEQSNIDLLTDDEKVIQSQKKMLAMMRICDGMTLEEMQNAAFTYKSLVEIVQRRDVRNACVPDVEPSQEWFDCLIEDISAIDCMYRGDPTYEHDAYWMKDRVIKMLEKRRDTANKDTKEQQK